MLLKETLFCPCTHLNGLDDVQSFDNLSKDDVLSIEPAGGFSANEELRTVGVGSYVRDDGNCVSFIFWGVRSLCYVAYIFEMLDQLAGRTYRRWPWTRFLVQCA